MLYTFDKVYAKDNIILAGVDEAGRGPLAGPVYAAAVILNKNFVIEKLNDSKQLTEKRRNLLYEEITNTAVSYCIATASVEEIDSINILKASLLAMRRAVEGLAVKPELVLVDGNTDPSLEYKTTCIVKGDALSASIAAASILAKVARDKYLVELAEQYPNYFFEKHKGYPTKLHYQMLDKFGPCKEHRNSFLKKWRISRIG